MNDVLPASLSRRLLLALLGYRCVDGVWCGPGPCLSEEQVDAMSDAQWSRYLRRWLTSATSAN
jgi:hypothetical protein